MVRFVSHKKHQELSMQSTLRNFRSTATAQRSICWPAVQWSKVKSMSYKSHLLDAKSKPTSCKSRSCPDYIISPPLLVADGQQEHDQVPVNIWTQPTVRLTTYLMRMRTAVVIVKKSPIYRIKLLVSILSWCCRPICSALTFLDEDCRQHLMRMTRMILIKVPLPPSHLSPWIYIVRLPWI